VRTVVANRALSNSGNSAQSRRDIALRESNEPEPSSIFNDFSRWIEQYLAVPSGEARPVLETEGEVLALMRRESLARLIESDPENAIRLAVPPATAALDLTAS